MKLGIIIPLKAKAVSKDWNVVEQSLKATLESVKHQTNQNFKAVVVGHDCPTFLENNNFHPNVSFLEYKDSPPPKITADNDSNQLKFELDRCNKIYSGYKHLDDDSVSHFFPLDADDLISRHLTAIVLNQVSDHNVLIENGYVYYKSKETLNETNSFSTFCGSSMVAASTLLKKNGDDKNFESFLFKKVGHVSMKEYLDSSKVPYLSPKERLAMYIRDNGENISRLGKTTTFYSIKRSLKMLLRKKRLTQTTKRDFSITS